MNTDVSLPHSQAFPQFLCHVWICYKSWGGASLQISYYNFYYSVYSQHVTQDLINLHPKVDTTTLQEHNLGQ